MTLTKELTPEQEKAIIRSTDDNNLARGTSMTPDEFLEALFTDSLESMVAFWNQKDASNFVGKIVSNFSKLDDKDRASIESIVSAKADVADVAQPV